MSFPEAFLTEIAHKQRLTEKETEAFRSVFGKQGKTMTRQAIADSLHIHKSTLGSRLSGIYKKFSFLDDGPGKENDLRQHLVTQLQNWQVTNSTASEDAEPDIDTRVQKVRNAIQPYIQEKCGTMRVLDMSHPIGLGEIYTHVNILERITGRIGRKMADLNGKVDREQFDRFGLGNVREKRVPGLDAVEKYAKLMVLGKPGSGKTTFLKYLAMHCIGGKFQPARVPIFVTLKDFAETPGKPDLLTYLNTYLDRGVSLADVVRGGRAFLLLDGLDEVRESDSSRVLQQIGEISLQFPHNRYTIACRIAAQEYRFEPFTEVEIADFDDKQIADFSGKWFGNKNDPVKAERFAQKLKEDKPIRELASSPLLLTLLCLVFEDSGSFPGNRAELYQNGVDVLLKKWDATRNIERDVVYQKLSLKRKQDLLGNVAYTTFKAGNYFFKQRQVERYISQYIENLPGASTDPEALECDSAAVLKSIEAQHGLFVERARGIYSFSHLTFHEYFTAKKIVTRCNPEAMDDPSLLELASHVTETHWREVFLLAVGMLDSADVLLQLMKEQIDGLLAGDEKLQQFLTWVDEKARSVEAPYNLTAMRLFYYELPSTCVTSHINIHPNSTAINLVESVRVYLSLCQICNYFDIRILTNINIKKSAFTFPNDELLLDLVISGMRTILLKTNGNLKHDFDFEKLTNNRTKDKEYFFLDLCSSRSAHILTWEIDTKENNLIQEFEGVIDFLILYFFITRTKKVLKENNLEVKDVANKLLVVISKGQKAIKTCWNQNSKIWLKNLMNAMTRERNIGYDWQFNNKQKKLIGKYYDANKLLVDCLKSDCYVSREVRQEIEETLLLPISQINKQQG